MAGNRAASAQMAASAKSRAVSASTELEVVRAVASMAAFENAVNSIEQIAATLSRKK